MRPRQATHGVDHDRAAIGGAQNAAEQLHQMIVQAAVDFPFVNQVGRSRGDENVGILPLMIVGSVGIGQQQSGRRGGRKLG